MSRVAVVVTRGDPATLAAMVEACRTAIEQGHAVTVFFRDESIPAICASPVAARLAGDGPFDADGHARVGELLDGLIASGGDVRMHACSSSLYVWGVTATDLRAGVLGVRGLIAFLAEDVAGAACVLSY